jgi:S-adenosylmethionine decarboxylase
MIGSHLLVDFYDVAPERLNDADALARLLNAAAAAGHMHPLGSPVMHSFPGGGVTGFLLLSESHLALHTYPEHGYLALDLFSCGQADPRAALAVFREALTPGYDQATAIVRGAEIGS